MSVFEGCLSYFDAMPSDVMQDIKALYFKQRYEKVVDQLNEMNNIKQYYTIVMNQLKEMNEIREDDNADYEETRVKNETYMLTAPRSFRSGLFLSSWVVDVELWRPLPNRLKCCKKVGLTFITFFCQYSHELRDDHDMELSILFDTENATWFDLYERANFLIDKSKDHHHIYIEGFDIVGDVINISAGS